MVARHTFWNISSGLKISLYVFASFAICIFLYGFYRRYRLWKQGRKVKVKWEDVRDNIKIFLTMTVKQEKIKRDKFFGLMHRFTSYGFVILFIGTCLVVVDYDFHIPILRGNFYLFYELFLDVFGVLFIAGLLMAIWIRSKKKRPRLKNGFADNAFLWLLVFIGIGGFMVEGIRIAETKVEYGGWSPVGYALAKLFQNNQGLSGLYGVFWFSHALLAFLLIALIPYTKLFHIIMAPINIFFQPIHRTGMLRNPEYEMKKTGQIVTDLNNIQSVTKIKDFTTWQLLSTDACTECGRCDSQCPANISGKPLSPRSIVLKIRDNMAKEREVASFISAEELQSCTTCSACVEACPVAINHVDLIMSMRRGLISESVMGKQVENMLLNVEEQQNIWGKPWSERSRWSEGLQVPQLDREDNEVIQEEII
ncbi:(Fe-S)-binding protein [Bacillus salipaludis]|nr:(Fe-S)-binding protein [Bacillus salipaludis]